MAIQLNKAILIGYLAAEPEVQGQRGDIVKIRVGTSEHWTNKETGELEQRTQWHNVVIYNDNVGRYVTRYANKGDLVYVEGQIETRKWDRSESGLDDKYFTEIIVKQYNGNVQILPKDRKEVPDERQRAAGSAEAKRASKPLSGSKETEYGRDLDDEIPF